MSLSDPLGDMLTRIRNAQIRKKDYVHMPASRFRGNVLEVLEREGFDEKAIEEIANLSPPLGKKTRQLFDIRDKFQYKQNKEKIKEDELFEIAINAGAKDCLTLDNIFEVITEKEDFYKVIVNSKMALNLTRGKPLKYLTSNRIASLIGNGLLTFIDEKVQMNDFFNKNEGFF